MGYKNTFTQLALDNIKRNGLTDLLAWLEKSDFYTAPASTRYHDAFEGGLCKHSIEVCRHLMRLSEFYGDSYPLESLTIVGLFHDLCKIGLYKTDFRNVKDEQGVWHKVPCYRHEEDFPFGGHGSKSVYLVQNFMKLDPEEAVAINCHMGAWDTSTYGNPSKAFETYKLAWLLHVADEAATYLNEEDN